jgi:hypothetical protein
MNQPTNQPTKCFRQGYDDARAGVLVAVADWLTKCHEYKEGYSAGGIVNGRLWGGAPELTTVEVLPGLDLALFPWEDAAVVAEELSDLFAEIDALPGLGWPPSEDELEAMYLAKSDPTWVAWLAEGAPVAGFTWAIPDDVAWRVILPAEDREDWIGF